ncbi:MAG: gliding motility-associated C-terminal domain-containing protein [Bacteroidales bacterium]
MKRLFVFEILLLLIISYSVKSQNKTIFLDAANHKSTTTLCDGEFYDNSKNGNYTTNMDYWTTICPAQANSRTKLEFDMFDIHPSDTVFIYYGTSINDEKAVFQDNGLTYFQNNDLEGKLISPPITDLSGCLTVRLKSDKTGVAKGWKARISCEGTCQDVYVKLAPTFTKYDSNGEKTNRPVREGTDVDTIKVSNPSYGYDFAKVENNGSIGYYKIDTVRFVAIDICEGDSVVLKADPQFPYNDASYHQTPQSCIYIWGFGDNDKGYDTIKFNPEIGHKWKKVSGYDMHLYITDTSHGGCVAKNSLNARVRIAQNPIKMENKVADMCSGDKQPVNVDYSGTATIVLDSFKINQAEREIFETRKFIPDGGSTSSGNATYEDPITFSSFSSGATLSSGKEIADICINMEHSSIGDIKIELRCPENKTAVLKYFDKKKKGKKRYFLGKPAGSMQYAFIDPTTADKKNNLTDTIKNPIGECWQYCWSNTYLKNAQGVLCGDLPNVVRNFSLSSTKVPFVNNVIDSTHFWGYADTINLTINVAPDTIHIYNNKILVSKNNDIVTSSNGTSQSYPTGSAIIIKTGDSYSTTSTGREFLYTKSDDTNIFSIGVNMQQEIPIIDNGNSYPVSYGDTVKYHKYNLTLFKNNVQTTPAYGDVFRINNTSGTNVTININTSTEQTLIVDSIRLITSYIDEFRPYKNDSYTAKYGDYIRTVAYSYEKDSIIAYGDTSQFLQTPKQNVTGTIAYNFDAINQTQNYINATTVDLNGFDPLIGCSLNGTWTIRITDNLAEDNGWICSWWMDFDLSSSTDWTYSVPIDTVIWGGPYITKPTKTSAIIAPPVTQHGEFTYNVKVIDDFGCQWPTSTNISIVGTPIVNLGPDKEICEGQSVILNAGNVGAARYDWEPTGDTTQTITFTPKDNEFGPKTFIAMVTNNNGKLYCYGNDTIKLNVHPGAAASFSSDKFPLEGCEPYTFQLLSTSSEVAKYEWRLGNVISNEPNPSFTFPSGSYNLDLKVTSPYGCVDSLHYDSIVNVFSSLSADFSWKPANPYASNPSVKMINLTEPNDEINNRYRWEVQSNKYDPLDVENIFETDPYYKWVAQDGKSIAGEYSITLDAYSYNIAPSGNIYECHDTVSKVITIVNDNLIFPTVVTPNGDGINDIFEIHNLIEGQAYPDNELTIYNRYGKRIYFVQDIRTKSQFWNPALTNSPTGTYFYRFIAKGPVQNMEFNGSVELLKE